MKRPEPKSWPPHRIVDHQNERPDLRAERLAQSDVLLELPPRLRRYERVRHLQIGAAAFIAVVWIFIALVFVVFG